MITINLFASELAFEVVVEIVKLLPDHGLNRRVGQHQRIPPRGPSLLNADADIIGGTDGFARLERRSRRDRRTSRPGVWTPESRPHCRSLTNPLRGRCQHERVVLFTCLRARLLQGSNGGHDVTPAERSPPPFLFIIGSGRSGTTLLRSMFDAHPQMAVTHEAHFVATMGRHRHRYADNANHFDLQRFLRDLFDDKKFLALGLDERELSAALADPPPLTFPDAVRRVFEFYANRDGKLRYGDKTPGYVLRVPLLAGLFPEARFIHLIRDGRDVAVSFSHVRFGPRSAGETAIYWKRRVLQGRHDGRALGEHRYREVRYEDLVNEPEAILTDLCSFADLDFDPAMVRYFDGAGRFVESTGVPEAHQRLFLPPTAGLRDWRVELAPEEVRSFEAVAGNVLDDLGYGRAVGNLSLADRTGAWRVRFVWHGVRFRFLVRRMLGRPTSPASQSGPASFDR